MNHDSAQKDIVSILFQQLSLANFLAALHLDSPPRVSEEHRRDPDISMKFVSDASTCRFQGNQHPSHCFKCSSRLRRIVTCIRPNQKIQPNLDLYLYLRYIFSQLLLMVSVSKYLKDTEDTVLMYLYLVRRSKIFVSVATLQKGNSSTL